MCGITGVISRRAIVAREEVETSIQTLKHRGPDGSGMYFSKNQNVGLGHTRLSIIDLTEDGAQPMHLEERWHITFNGEIYNYIELKKELIQKGYEFHTHSDTEVLLKMYQAYGSDCLEHLDGMFSFVIYDELNNLVFAARDRFGEKPFYYNFNSERFVFASEIKGLMPYGVSKSWRNKAMEDFLSYGIEVDELDPSLTFFEDIVQLKPAHFLELDLNSWKMNLNNYWNLDSIKSNNSISFEEAKQKVRALFNEGLVRRLRSDVKVGTSLSGGIDSSVVALSIINYPNYSKDLNTFSARFKGYKNDEGRHMECVEMTSDRIQPHHVWLTEKEFIDNVVKLNQAQEEPYGSASILAQYLVMKEARNSNTLVMLDGQGADEYFAGYLVYYIRYIRQLEMHNPSRYKEELLYYNQLNIQQPYSSFRKSESLRMKLGRYKAKMKGVDVISKSLLKERLKIDTQSGHLQGLLRYCDRNSMANSVESRLPFLYHKLVEYVLSLPDEYLLHKGITKYILRESFSDIVPSPILERRDKIGYETPNEQWLEKYQAQIKDKEKFLINNFNVSNDSIPLWRSYLASAYLNQIEY